jgi:two-component system KDP operon response regulator KdpE
MTHILVIDDDNLVTRAAGAILTAAGFTVSTAENRRSGLESLRTNCPDLVITDILMPVMEGIETILQLRKLDSKLPIVAMSGGWSSGDGGKPSDPL